MNTLLAGTLHGFHRYVQTLAPKVVNDICQSVQAYTDAEAGTYVTVGVLSAAAASDLHFGFALGSPSDMPPSAAAS